MNQEFILNTPATSVAAKPDKANHQTTKPEYEGKQSFSSALDEQVEKRSVESEHQIKNTKSTEDQADNQLQKDEEKPLVELGKIVKKRDEENKGQLEKTKPIEGQIDNKLQNNNEESQSFSLAFGQQVEGHSVGNERQFEKAKPAEEQADNKSQENVDEQESGKILPGGDGVEKIQIEIPEIKNAEVIEEIAEKLLDVSIITELKSEIAKPLTTKLASPEQLAAASVAITESSQSKVKNQLQSEVKTNPIFIATVSGKNENSDVGDLELEKKSITTNLRSDIFHALSKNKAPESALLDNAVSKDHKTVLNQLSDRAERPGRSAATFSSALSATPSLNSTAVASNSVTQPALAIQPAIHSEAWNRVLSSRVVWMAREGIQEASLKLNPATLGAVDVKLNMHNDQANVLFIAQNAATRDALEQALPKLRESFAENGMQLADAEVADQEFEQPEEEAAQNGTGLATQSESENEQQVTDTEQDVEMGLSIYA